MSWQAIFLAVDPSDHPTGQLVALEYDSEFGKPKALLGALIKSLNDQEAAPYFTQAFPLISEGSFWVFAREHDNLITSITFEVAVPNMFRDADDFQEELRSLRDGENVATVDTKLASDGVLKTETPRMSGLVDYVEKGGGELKASAADGARYASSAHERRVTVDIDHHSRNTPKFLREILTVLDRIFP